MKKMLFWLMCMAFVACFCSMAYAAFVPIISGNDVFISAEWPPEHVVTNWEYKDPGWLSSSEGIILNKDNQDCGKCHYIKATVKNIIPEPNQRLPAGNKA